MAVIERIRKRSGLLIAIIGIALLAFVLQDLFRSTGTRRAKKLMVVDGKEIPVADFDRLVSENMAGYENLSLEQKVNFQNGILERMIWERIMNKEFDAVGMTVTDDELRDQFLGSEPSILVKNSFSDGNGFNRDLLVTRLQDLENAPDQYRAQWAEFENQVKEYRLMTKFGNLVKASYYVPNRLAEKYYENKSTRKVDVVGLLFSAIPDSLVTVTDQDYKNYYEEHKYLYDRDEHRGIEYVLFEIGPSELDEQDTKQQVENLKAGFANTNDVAGFLKDNRSELSYDTTWLGRPDVPAEAEGMLFDPETEAGFVYGPYYEAQDNSYRLIRLVDRQLIEDSLMVRVAVLSKTPMPSSKTDKEIKARAKQFLTENNTHDKFIAAIEAEGLTKNVQKELYPSTLGLSVNNSFIKNSRNIVQWSFAEDRKEGDMEMFEFDDMYLVAMLTDIVPEGYVPMDKLKEQFKDPVLKKKKAEKAAELMKNYGTDYERMVKELGAEIVKDLTVSFETVNVGKFGGGANVIGTILGMKEGEVVGPIAGDASAFIITKVTPEKPAKEYDYNTIATERKSQFDNRVKGGNSQDMDAIDGIYEALKKNAKIKDNRFLKF